MTTATDDELSGIPDFVREKLLEMRQNIDQLESVYGELEKCSNKDLQAKVRLLETRRAIIIIIIIIIIIHSLLFSFS